MSINVSNSNCRQRECIFFRILKNNVCLGVTIVGRDGVRFLQNLRKSSKRLYEYASPERIRGHRSIVSSRRRAILACFGLVALIVGLSQIVFLIVRHPSPLHPRVISVEMLWGGTEKSKTLYSEVQALLRMDRDILKADDSRLLRLIGDNFIVPPMPHIRDGSSDVQPVVQTPMARAVDEIMAGRRRGIFVECNDADAYRISSAFWLEKRRGWTGLIVHEDPAFFYRSPHGRNRKSPVVTVCLARQGQHPEFRHLRHSVKDRNNKISKMNKVSSKIGNVSQMDDQTELLVCFPLYSVLLAASMSHVDYLSLDLNGSELPVLRTIPFELLNISVISTGLRGGNDEMDDGKNITEFMNSKGYCLHSNVHRKPTELLREINFLVFFKPNVVRARRAGQQTVCLIM